MIARPLGAAQVVGYTGGDADVAQLVERDLAKVEVAGSSPVVRSGALGLADDPGPRDRGR